MLEDEGTLTYQMTASDTEGDTIRFKIDPTSSVTANRDLTVSEDGLMIYTPNLNYHGTFDIPVILYEVAQPEIPPAVSMVTITMEVTSTNDAPHAFAFSNRVSILLPDPTEPILTLIEQNLVNDTVSLYTWHFGAYDVDDGANLTLYYTAPKNGSLYVADMMMTVPSCSGEDTEDIPCRNMSLPHPAGELTWVYQTFTYQPKPDFHGYDEVRVYVEDNAGVFSDVVTLRFAVMERPCQNGATCTSKNSSLYSCDNYRRAESFDDHYTCLCAPGWLGMHCDVDVDECISAPCRWPYMCYNLENHYTCACAPGDDNCDGLEAWMIGLIVLAIILLGIISFLAWYIFMVKRGRLKWSSLWTRLRGQRSRGSSSGSDGRESKMAFVNRTFDDDIFNQDGQQEQNFSGGASWVIYSGRPRHDPTSPGSTDERMQIRHVPALDDTPTRERRTRNPSPFQSTGLNTPDEEITQIETDHPDPLPDYPRSNSPVQQQRPWTRPRPLNGFSNQAMEPEPDYLK